jgi:hypothetical protein
MFVLKNKWWNIEKYVKKEKKGKKSLNSNLNLTQNEGQIIIEI